MQQNSSLWLLSILMGILLFLFCLSINEKKLAASLSTENKQLKAIIAEKGNYCKALLSDPVVKQIFNGYLKEKK